MWELTQAVVLIKQPAVHCRHLLPLELPPILCLLTRCRSLRFRHLLMRLSSADSRAVRFRLSPAAARMNFAELCLSIFATTRSTRATGLSTLTVLQSRRCDRINSVAFSEDRFTCLDSAKEVLLL